jgi:hypothetical protein
MEEVYQRGMSEHWMRRNMRGIWDIYRDGVGIREGNEGIGME